MPNTKKPKLELWIAIANLALTAVVGIAVAIYLQRAEQNFQAELQKKNEDFQRQLVQLQSEVSNDSQSARLNIVSFCDESGTMRTTFSCNGVHGFEIENYGQAVAENLRIAVYNYDLSGYWASAINDISQFHFSTPNLSFKLKSETTHTERLLTYIKGDNTIIFTIDKMPPNSKIMFYVYVDPDIPTKNISFIWELPVSYPSANKQIWESQNGYLLTSFFEDLVGTKIANFHGDVSCDNCQKIDGKIAFEIPSLIKVSSVTSEEPLLDGDTYTTKLLVTADYEIPQNVSAEIQKIPLRSLKLITFGTDIFGLTFGDK